MATHSNILAWRIPWTEEHGRLLSMGSQSQKQLIQHSTHHTKYKVELCLLKWARRAQKGWVVQPMRPTTDQAIDEQLPETVFIIGNINGTSGA